MTTWCFGLMLLLGTPGWQAVGSGQRPPDAAISQPTGAEAEVRKLSAEEVEAFLRRDAVALARLWSDDFVVTNPLNRFVTKRQVLEMVEAGVLVITAFDRQIEYSKVYGDTVILAGRETVTWGGRMPNAGRTEELRITAIWMQQDGRWQQVARHANVVPASGSPR
jgi:ketosteroid isomerase-like protein